MVVLGSQKLVPFLELEQSAVVHSGLKEGRAQEKKNEQNGHMNLERICRGEKCIQFKLYRQQ